jgi:hypothetical protein
VDEIILLDDESKQIEKEDGRCSNADKFKVK